MCQLLGMNCNVPTDICFSFTGFQARGGGTDFHADGWGIAFFEGKGYAVKLGEHARSVNGYLSASDADRAAVKAPTGGETGNWKNYLEGKLLNPDGELVGCHLRQRGVPSRRGWHRRRGGLVR